MNITDLKNESKELNKKLYEYIRQVIREIQTYNKMTDKELYTEMLRQYKDWLNKR